jgi:hypothetical protein
MSRSPHRGVHWEHRVIFRVRDTAPQHLGKLNYADLDIIWSSSRQNTPKCTWLSSAVICGHTIRRIGTKALHILSYKHLTDKILVVWIHCLYIGDPNLMKIGQAVFEKIDIFGLDR